MLQFRLKSDQKMFQNKVLLFLQKVSSQLYSLFEDSSDLLVVCCWTINKGATFKNSFRFFFFKNHVKNYPPCNEKQNFNLEQPNLFLMFSWWLPEQTKPHACLHLLLYTLFEVGWLVVWQGGIIRWDDQFCTGVYGKVHGTWGCRWGSPILL